MLTCHTKHKDMSKYCLQEVLLDAYENVRVHIYIYGHMDGSVGTAPFQKEQPTRRDPAPREKGGEETGNRGVPKTRCGGSHLPVPACRHTVMQSMIA